MQVMLQNQFVLYYLYALSHHCKHSYLFIFTRYVVSSFAIKTIIRATIMRTIPSLLDYLNLIILFQ